MNIGGLRHRITLSRPSEGPTGYDPVVTNEPASIRFMSPGSPESIQFGMPATFSGFLIGVRYHADFASAAAWRIEDELGRVFQISSYGDSKDRQHELQFWCTQLQ